MLTADKAIDQVAELRRFHEDERTTLDVVRRYWKGKQRLPAVIPREAPREVRVMARISRVNICSIVVDALAQSMFVDGFRSPGEPGKGAESDDLEVWGAWQRNKLDARQTGLHRSTFAYGAAYESVLPGDIGAVIRQHSPRSMFVLYGEDPDWPMSALERLGNGLWKLFEEDGYHYVSEKPSRSGSNGDGSGGYDYVDGTEHGLGVVPVVRYLDEEDLDIDDDVEPDQGFLEQGQVDPPNRGQVPPLMPIQDQVDLTTFNLLVAQQYTAFRQRYAIGWVAEDEKEKMKAAASTFWNFDASPDKTAEDGMELGEFSQTDLKGYIESRKETVKYAATLSQTPVHELVGELVNLSAEALAAAEAGRDRKVDERQTLAGESHEQKFWLVGQIEGIEVPDDAQVVWRDTSARSFAATVDALGKLTQLLGIPPEELWERVPGATKQDIERWKAAKQDGNAFQVLTDRLNAQVQSASANPNGNQPAEPALA